MQSQPSATVGRALARLVATLALSGVVHIQAAELVVSPASLSNSYSGDILFLITNIASGETVRLEQFLDLNTNGTIDSSDLLVQSFKLTDGQVTSFSGIRDADIPGDEDAVAGQITSSMSFPNSPEMARLAATYLFRLSSPGGTFTSVVRPFAVQQTAFPQHVSGRVTSGASPVPYAAVGILDLSGGNAEFVAGTIADGSGNYTLAAPSGTYAIFSIKQGLVSDLGSNLFTLNPSQASTQNLSMIVGTTTISGSIVDASTAAGLPAVQLFIQSTTSTLTAITSSDATGNFSVSVPPDQWKFNLSDMSLARLGYLRPATKPKVSTIAGNVSGMMIRLTKANALVYGTVKTDTGAPVPGLSIAANDSQSLYFSSATTDANGNYSFGVVNGSWQVGVSDCLGYGCPTNNFGTVAVNGGNVVVNFTLLSPAQLSLSFDHLTYGGDFGAGFTPAIPFPIAIKQYSAVLTVHVNAAFPPLNSVLFTGPAGSGLTNSPADSANPGNASIVYFSSAVSNPKLAPGGDWTVSYNGIPTSFNVPDPQAASRLVAPVPTASVSGNNLTGFTWIYKDSNGVVLPAPPAFITQLEVKIFDKNFNVLYPSTAFPPATTNYSLGLTIPWSNVGRVRTLYHDTLGNRYFLNYNRAAPDLGSEKGLSNNQFEILVNGLAGQNYTLQYSSTLTNWNTLLITNSPVSPFKVSDSNPSSSYRFYRALLGP